MVVLAHLTVAKVAERLSLHLRVGWTLIRVIGGTAGLPHVCHGLSVAIIGATAGAIILVGTVAAEACRTDRLVARSLGVEAAVAGTLCPAASTLAVVRVTALLRLVGVSVSASDATAHRLEVHFEVIAVIW